MSVVNVMQALAGENIRVEVGEGWSVAQCDHATLGAALRAAGVKCDALIVDAPYSERTHAGHNGVASGTARRTINYAAWTAADVATFVSVWGDVTDGWIVSLTDDDLALVWRDEMECAGRCVFRSVPCVIRGMSVRFAGDGPSSWSVHAMTSRPRSRRFATWGTLPGAYDVQKERQPVTGGKPVQLMRALVRDYSKHGALVCDPCMGGGTTLVAALEEGRRAIGCEPDAERYEIAVERLRATTRQTRLQFSPAVQLGLGGEL
jgi:hypothetical protein